MLLELIATMEISVNVTSLNNSGTAELHAMLLIEITCGDKSFKTRMEKKIILKFSPHELFKKADRH